MQSYLFGIANLFLSSTVNINGFKFFVTISKCHAKFKFLSIVISSNSKKDETFCPTTFPTLMNCPLTLLKAVA